MPISARGAAGGLSAAPDDGTVAHGYQAWLRQVLLTLPGAQRASVSVLAWEAAVVHEADGSDGAVGRALTDPDEAMRELGWDHWRERFPVSSWIVTALDDPDGCDRSDR